MRQQADDLAEELVDFDELLVVCHGEPGSARDRAIELGERAAGTAGAMNPLPHGETEPRVTGATWRFGRRRLSLDRPRILAILNVTPDSFSDGSTNPDVAFAHAQQQISDGADVIDIGGESTRPGASPVDVATELGRVLPVVCALREGAPDVPISVDTTKSAVADAVLGAGADIINDVSGLRLDGRMAAVVAMHGAGIIVMHSRGEVAEMAGDRYAVYGEVVNEVEHELWAAVLRAEAGGIARDAIVIDPGIGFAKRAEHSLAMLRAIPRLAAAGLPVLVGASRKRVVGVLSGIAEPAARDSGSVGAHVAALALGARLFRVHDVRAHRQALDVAWAILRPDGGAEGEG